MNTETIKNWSGSVETKARGDRQTRARNRDYRDHIRSDTISLTGQSDGSLPFNDSLRQR